MTEEKKKELFPIFAFLYSKQMNPEKYGKASNIEEWTSLIQKSPADIELISNAAAELSEEEWSNIEAQLESAPGEETLSYLKNGAKLEKLKTLKKSKKLPPKKCSCGCDMVDKKEAGGKITSECSCKCGGGKMKEGARIKSPQEKLDLVKQAPTKVRNIYEKMKALKVK